MIYDHRGRAIERVKQYGYLAGPAEYRAIETKPAGELELVDAIATERVPLEDDDDEEDYIE